MPGANEKAPYVLDLADLQAVKRLDAVITRCYEVTKPEETKPLLWRILYNCVLRLWQNQSTVRITTLCWDLDQECRQNYEEDGI